MLLIQYVYASIINSVMHEPVTMALLGIKLLLVALLLVVVIERLVFKRRS